MEAFVTDLVEFITARLDEDEATARAAGQGWYDYDPERSIAFVSREDTIHVAHHSPARVLREVEAKRDIVGEHRTGRYGECDRCREPGLDRNQSAPCRTLRLLALPYADHPDYRSEWAPA